MASAAGSGVGPLGSKAAAGYHLVQRRVLPVAGQARDRADHVLQGRGNLRSGAVLKELLAIAAKGVELRVKCGFHRGSIAAEGDAIAAGRNRTHLKALVGEPVLEQLQITVGHPELRAELRGREPLVVAG